MHRTAFFVVLAVIAAMSGCRDRGSGRDPASRIPDPATWTGNYELSFYDESGSPCSNGIGLILKLVPATERKSGYDLVAPLDFVEYTCMDTSDEIEFQGICMKFETRYALDNDFTLHGLAHPDGFVEGRFENGNDLVSAPSGTFRGERKQGDTSTALASQEWPEDRAGAAMNYSEEWEQNCSLPEPTSYNGYYDVIVDDGNRRGRWEMLLQLQPSTGSTFGGTASLIGSDGIGVPAGAGSSFTLNQGTGDLDFRLHFIMGFIGGYIMKGSVSRDGNITGTYEYTVEANANQIATGKRPPNETGTLSGHKK